MSTREGRKRRQHFTSQTTMGQVEIQGQAYLYISDSYSWFQGTINTEGESNYSFCGERVDAGGICSDLKNSKSKIHSISSTESSTPYQSDEELDMDLGIQLRDPVDNKSIIVSDSGSENSDETESLTTKDPMETEMGYYKMTLTDHYTGLIYNFSKVIINHVATGTNDSLLLSFDPNTQIHFRTENIYKGQKAAMVIQRSLGSSILLEKKCIVYSGQMELEFSDDCLISGRNWSL